MTVGLPRAGADATKRIVVLGGYGAFGARAVERLAREADLDVVIAGRSADRAAAAATELRETAVARIDCARIDATTATPDELRAVAAGIVINASGPFQSQDYTLARACIEAGVHYVDLADARAFVTGIGVLDEAAKRADVLVVSGASSVPALAASAIDAHLPRFGQLDSITHAITPGNSYDPGPATAASLLGALGRSFPITVDRGTETAYGWQGLTYRSIPGLGTRLFGYCEVPDLDLFPARYPGVRTVQFYAGVEVWLFQLALWALSWPVRWGLLRRPERLAGPLLAMKRRLAFLGTDRGGMLVELRGAGHDGHPLAIDWHLVARRGHGPFIPAIAAVIVAKKLARERISERGAMPCLGLFSLSEFMAEVEDLDITAGTS